MWRFALVLLGAVAACLVPRSSAIPLMNDEGYTNEKGYTKVLKERPMKKLVFNGEVVYVPAPAPLDPFSTRVPADEGFSPDAYETDMMLNNDQKEYLRERREDERNGRTKRKAVRDPIYRWPQAVVPYVISSSSSADSSYIYAAMDHWQSLTCIRFLPFSTELAESLKHYRRLQFVKRDGCWSYVGMQSGNSQQISIGIGCLELGTVAHEIGHAIGFQHEQSRPDRDDYVQVISDNIEAGMEYNFDKLSLSEVMDSSVVEYDYKSAMHYGPYGFSKDSKVPTLVTKDPLKMPYIGQRKGLSHYDVKLANLIYDCATACSQPLLECANGGFVDKTCTCQCSSGWAGTLCDEPSTDPTAVTEITLTAPSGVFESPDYASGNYPVLSTAMYYIVGAPDSTITLTFDSFVLEPYDTQATRCWDYVQVNADDPRYGGNKYCGSSFPPVTVTQGSLMVWFHSDETITAKGFRAHYTIDSPAQPSTKGPPTDPPNPTTKQQTEAAVTTTAKVTTTESVTTRTPVTEAPATTKIGAAATQVAVTTAGPESSWQFITSPDYPANYRANLRRVYKLTVDIGQRIYLYIDDMNIERSDDGSCSFDALIIDFGDSQNYFTTRLCGTRANVGPFVSLSNNVTITLVSDEYNEFRGFKASFRAIGTAFTGSCGGNFGGDSGSLASPNYPNKYPNRQYCEYVIEVAADKVVELTFHAFNLEAGPRTCEYDCLQIQLLQGVQDSDVSPLSLDGPNTPAGPIVSQSNTVVLLFQSDDYVQSDGFAATYRAISTSDV